MEIERAGVEYASLTVSAADPISSTPEIAFRRTGHHPDAQTQWFTAQWVDAPAATRTMRVLIAGPECNPVPTGAIQLRSGEYDTYVRFSQNPETLIRSGNMPLTVK